VARVLMLSFLRGPLEGQDLNEEIVRRALPSIPVLLLAVCSVPCVAAGTAAGGGSDGFWSTLNWPPARYGHTAVYDAGHDRMIMFGGYDNSHYMEPVGNQTLTWILTLSDPPRWTGIFPGGSAPSPRYTQSAIYDPARDRTIVFGGYDGQVLNEVYTLSLSGAPVWSPLVTSGTPPPARHRHTAIYDPLRDRMIVFGGTNDSTLYDDVWALSLSGAPEWSEIVAPGGPALRYRHSAIYDPVRDRMIVFGGRGTGSDFNDTWALDLTGVPAWSELHPPAPLPRTRGSHCAVYDPAGDRMVVYGGEGSTRNDAWSLTLSGPPAWSLLEPAGSPPPGHSSHTAIFDAARNRIVVFAGKPDSGLATSDLSVLTLGGTPAWSPIVKPLAPTAQAFHTSIYDPAGSRLIPFAGNTYFAGPINEAWSLSLDPAPLWSRLEPAGTLPEPRNAHVAIYDRLRERMVVYGGYSSYGGTWGVVTNDVWTLSLSGALAWGKTPSTGQTPAASYTTPRGFYDPIEDRMIYFLSYDSYRGFPTIWSLSMSPLGRWQYLSTGDVHPPSSESPNVIYDPQRDRLILFGGCLSDGMPPSDVWAISLRNRVWTQLPTLGPVPDSRCRYSAVYDPIRDRMLMIGGRGPLGHDSNEVWELTLTDPLTWRLISYHDPRPPTLTWSTAVAIPERDWIVVEGGYYGSSATNGTWILEGGRPTVPACECPGTPSWGAGGRLTLRYVLSHPLESRRKLTWTLKSERAWPGFPRQGVVTVEAAARETVTVEIAAPDSAMAGTNRLTFGVSFTGADGAEVTCTRELRAPLTTLDVPVAAVTAFLRIRPNPTRREVTAAFSLPVAGRATLELYDVAGRRLSRRELSLGEGNHLIAVAPNARLAPGVYVVKLSFGGRTLRARGVVID